MIELNKTQKSKITLMSSAPKSLYWLHILKNKQFNSNFKIELGTDHPFNGDTSKKIYNEFIRFRKKK